MPYGFDRREGMKRLDEAAHLVASIKSNAAPHAEMHAASVAPARGPQQLVPNFTVTAGGMRRVEGAHWRGLSPLAAAVAQARIRHEAKGGDREFVPPYGPGHIAMAEFYAALVEWREGSALRCSSFEAGREGGGSGQFIDTFIQRGLDLAQLHHRIGPDIAMAPRRHMDRGNARRTITVRAVVDMVCIGGQGLAEVLRRFGWEGDGKNCKALRLTLCAALDRMQGYEA
jgi:hypothetical protein